MDAKIADAFYSQGHWKDPAFIKKLAEEANVPETAVVEWLYRKMKPKHFDFFQPSEATIKKLAEEANVSEAFTKEWLSQKAYPELDVLYYSDKDLKRDRLILALTLSYAAFRIFLTFAAF